MINLEKAVDLYNILEPYLPPKESKSLDFINYVVNGMLDSREGAEKYLRSVQIMHDLTMKELQKKSSEEVLTLFIDGLVENKFSSLHTFLGSWKNG
ncbi:hypothetical protein GF373_17355 [bacterium]|nr:hypothetical protein [bacterium]